MRVGGAGVSVGVLPGWDVEVFEREQGAPNSPRSEGSGGRRLAILHGANFPLPPNRADFGHDLIGLMGLGEVFVALVEYGPGEAGKVLFAHEGIPAIDHDRFSVDASMGVVNGQAAAQYFFHVGDRAFCLYVAVGSFRLRARLAPLLEDFLGTLELD